MGKGQAGLSSSSLKATYRFIRPRSRIRIVDGEDVKCRAPCRHPATGGSGRSKDRCRSERSLGSCFIGKERSTSSNAESAAQAASFGCDWLVSVCDLENLWIRRVHSLESIRKFSRRRIAFGVKCLCCWSIAFARFHLIVEGQSMRWPLQRASKSKGFPLPIFELISRPT